MEDTGGAGWRLATARKPLWPTTQGARPPSQHLGREVTFTDTHEDHWRPGSVREALAVALRVLEAIAESKSKGDWPPALMRHVAKRMVPFLREMVARPAAVAAVNDLLGCYQHGSASLSGEVMAFLERYRFPKPWVAWTLLLLDVSTALFAPGSTGLPPGLLSPIVGHYRWLELAFLEGDPSDCGHVAGVRGRYPVVHVPLWGGFTRREAKAYLFAMCRGLLPKRCSVVRCLLWEVEWDTRGMVTPPWKGRPGKLLGDYYASLPPEGRAWPQHRALRWLISRLVDQLPLRWWPGGAPPNLEQAARYWAKLVWDGKSVKEIADEEYTNEEEVRFTLWRLGIAR
jgi:hypothetical protein